MNRALAATLVMLSFSANAASAHECKSELEKTRLERNGKDVACKWKDKSGRSEFDICHIISQGTIFGKTEMTFYIGAQRHQYTTKDNGIAEMGVDDNGNYKRLWTGKVTEKIVDEHDLRYTNVIDFSNGLHVEMFNNDG